MTATKPLPLSRLAIRVRPSIVSVAVTLLTFVAAVLVFWHGPFDSKLPGPIILSFNLFSVGVLGAVTYGLLLWQKKISRDPKEMVKVFFTLCLLPPFLGFTINVLILAVAISMMFH
jgi:hypothetical protein